MNAMPEPGNPSRVPTAGATTIAVTSGKGGVGKTSIATNLAIALTRLGHRVCLLDADMGLANVNILLGLRPTHTIEELLDGSATLDDLRLAGPDGLTIIPGVSDLRLLDENRALAARIGPALASLEHEFDYLILDTPAGMSGATLNFIQASNVTLLTITQEPTSLTDAFTLLKALHRRRYDGAVGVVVNMLPAGQNGERLFRRFNAAAQRYLSLSLTYIGHLGMDSAITRSVLRQQPVLIHSPESGAAAQLTRLGTELAAWTPPRGGQGRFSGHWAGTPFPVEHRPADEPRRSPPPATTITPPRESRAEVAAATADDGPAADPVAQTEALVAWMRSERVDQDLARRLFARLEQTFADRFRRRGTDIKSLVYEALLQGQLGRAEHRELTQNLYTAYKRRYGRTSPPADGATDERADITIRITQLRDELRRDARTASDALAALLESLIGDGDWGADEAAALIARLDQAYHRRHGQSGHSGNSEQALEEVRRDLRERGDAVRQLETTLRTLLAQQAALEQRLEQATAHAPGPAVGNRREP